MPRYQIPMAAIEAIIRRGTLYVTADSPEQAELAARSGLGNLYWEPVNDRDVTLTKPTSVGKPFLYEGDR